MTHPFSLGRVHAPDPRDANYPMAAVLPEKLVTAGYRYWYDNTIWLDQGDTPECTAYAWDHWLADSPVQNYIQGPAGPAPEFPPDDIYTAEKKIDGLPAGGEGSTVRAGAQVLQARGFVGSYHWAQSMNDAIAALLNVGPLVIGIP